MAVYTIVASSTSPQGPFEVSAGTVTVGEGDRFILDPSVDASVSFTAAGGHPANLEVEIAQSNTHSLTLTFGQGLAPSVVIGNDVALANIRLDARKATSLHLTAGDRVSLGECSRSERGINTIIAGDDFIGRSDLRTGSGPGGVHLGTDASIGGTDGGSGNGIVQTRTTPAAGETRAETAEVVCFAAGTRISTACGAIAIEDLRPGDLVTTLDHALQPIRWIGSRHLDTAALDARAELRPVRIRAGVLGGGLPLRDLVVSSNHRVLVRSPIAQRMFGASEILIPACKLTGIDGIDVLDDATPVTYWNLLFDCHEIVFAEGATTESMLTGPQAIKGLPGDAVDEIRAICPKLADPAHRPVPARPIRDVGRMTRAFASRDSRHDKALLEEHV